MVILLLAVLTQDGSNAISDAAKKLEAAGSYTYSLEIQMDGADREGRRVMSGILGKFHKDMGLTSNLGGRGMLFRSGDSVFVKWGDRDWDQVGKREDGKGRRHRGRGRSSDWIKSIRPPHENVLHLAGGLSEVREEAEPEAVEDLPCRVFEGALSREILEEGMLGRMLKRFGADREAEVSGSLRGWIDGKGVLRRYRVSTSVTVELQGAPVEFVTTRALTFSKVGETQVAIPEELQERIGTATPGGDKPDEK